MQPIRPLDGATAAQLASSLAISTFEDAVRELVQNSLDAGADRIVVKLDVASLTVSVTDDGSGMPPEGLRMLGQRHATSRMSRLDDAGRHFGFRGEALSSLARLGGVRVVSRCGEATFGVDVSAGGPVEPFDHADETRNPHNMNSFYIEPFAASGTTVVVSDLFAGVPVRRQQILESPQLQILDNVRHALAPALRPCHLVVWYNCRGYLERLFSVGPNTNVLNGVLGLDHRYKRIRCGCRGVQLEALVSQTPVSTRKYQFVTVNNRRLELGREALQSLNRIFQASSYGRSVYVSPRRRSYPVFLAQFRCELPASDLIQDPTKRIWAPSNNEVFVAMLRTAFQRLVDGTTSSRQTSPRKSKPPSHPSKSTVFEYTGPELVQRILTGDYRILRQLENKVIVLLIGKQMFALDQHACDERVKVEALYKEVVPNLRADIVAADVKLALNDEQTDALMLARDSLASFGVRVDASCSRITTIPAILQGRERLLQHQLVEYCYDLGSSQKTVGVGVDNLPGFIVEAINMKACKSAVRFGTPLTRAEMDTLVKSLAMCRSPFRCAHGRTAIAPLYDTGN